MLESTPYIPVNGSYRIGTGKARPVADLKVNLYKHERSGASIDIIALGVDGYVTLTLNRGDARDLAHAILEALGDSPHTISNEGE